MNRVNIEQARKLKELGYRIPTEYYYDSDNHKFIGHSETGEYDFNDPEYLAYDTNPKIKSFSAPYISEALEWIREEKGIFSWIEKGFHFWPKIENYNLLSIDFDNTYYDYYEEAESALLDELIHILEEK